MVKKGAGLIIGMIVIIAMLAGLSGQAVAKPVAPVRVLIGVDNSIKSVMRQQIKETAGVQIEYEYNKLPIIVATMPRHVVDKMRFSATIDGRRTPIGRQCREHWCNISKIALSQQRLFPTMDEGNGKMQTKSFRDWAVELIYSPWA